MAVFKGTNTEFKRYIGPRFRNVVNMITKKQKAAVGACEHCGSEEYLESAHIHGRGRIQIIDLLLGRRGNSEDVEVDLRDFEERFKLEHEPFEKAILVLCSACHRKYDANEERHIPATRTGASVETQQITPGTIPFESEILPITLDPKEPSAFKVELLKRKKAEITTFYNDGRSITRPWRAETFASTSNVFGNLRSRPEFRKGKWQESGIAKVHVKVPPASIGVLPREVL